MNKKEEVRTQKIEIRVTSEEKEKYLQKAKMVNMNLSTYLRESLKNDNVIIVEKMVDFLETKESKKNVLSEKKLLYGLANNLNQLTKLSHQNKNVHEEIEDLLHRIKEIILSKY